MGELIAKVVAKILHAAPEILERLIVSFLRNNPEIVLLPLPTLVLAALIVGAIALIHLMLLRMTSRRRARIFISFQHDREAMAEHLAGSMTALGVSPSRLPFVENAEHDSLLETVRREISGCDVFVCIPGVRASFVENEVSMAFALQKPLLFLSVEGDTARIPNTAKKGYPIFVLERLQHKGPRTFVNFCSYLAADWRSTLRIYRAVLENLLLGVVVFFIVNATCLFVWTHRADQGTDSSIAFPTLTDDGGFEKWWNVVVSDPVTWIQTLAVHPTTIAFVTLSLAQYLAIYGAFAAKRIMLRTRVRRTISGQKFQENSLPKMLDASLWKADLLKILYRGDVRAEHEPDTPQAQSA